MTLLLAFATAHAQEQTIKLPAYDADIHKTSVSGLSSGAFMTSQLYMVFSDIMTGAGIVAGGPYLCAKSWAANTLVQNATTTCMNPLTASTGPNTPVLVKHAALLADYGYIDPLKNLQDDRIYIFSGSRDKTVTTTVVNQTRVLQVRRRAGSVHSVQQEHRRGPCLRDRQRHGCRLRADPAPISTTATSNNPPPSSTTSIRA
ncbi:hypothetical protein ACFSHR_07350 [Azotobacter chroococcum]